MTASLLVAQHVALVIIGLVAAFGAVVAGGSSSQLRSVLGATLAMGAGGAAATLAGASTIGVVLIVVAVAFAAVGVLAAGPASTPGRRTRASRQIEARDVIALVAGLVVVVAVVTAGIVGLGGTHAVTGHAHRAAYLGNAFAHQAMGPFELVGVIALVLVSGVVVVARRLEAGNDRGEPGHD